MKPAENPNESATGRMFACLFFLSLMIHAALCTWMAMMPTDIRHIPGRSEQPRTITATARQIHEVVQQVRVRQADEVRDKVQELLDMQKELAAARARKFDEYRQSAQAQEAGALEKALAAELLALPAQEKALVAQQQTGPLITQAVTAWSDISQCLDEASRKVAKEKHSQLMKEIKAAFESAKQGQVEADLSVAEALRQLTFAAGDEVLPARQAQEATRQAQASANTAQDATSSTIGAIGDMNWQLGTREREAGQAKSAAHTARERTKSLEAQLARLTKEVEVQDHRTVEAVAKAEKSKTKGDADRASRQKDLAEKTRLKLPIKTAEVEAQRAKIDPAQKMADEKKTVMEQGRQGIASQLNRGAEAQSTAITVQHAGIEAQKNAITLLQKLLEANAGNPEDPADPSEETSLAVAQADAPGAESIDGANLASRNFGELYELAVNAEQAATADYRDIRAATVAVLTNKTLEEASRVTDVVQPTRATVESALFSKEIGTAQDASAHTKAVRAALGELDSMVTLSRKMLETTLNESANSSENGQGVSVSLAESKAKSDQLAALEEAAQNDDNAQAKDVSHLMKKSSGKPAGGGASTPSRPGSGKGPVSAPNQIWPLAKNGGNAVPGRKILTGGGAADWMYLDSWYLIGPFPNPARRNIHTAFPPESVIDLDASYPGEHGKSLRWRFIQSPEAMVSPKRPEDSEQAIYYAYTELWFDQEMDAWLALASDDFGKVWVNDMPIWKSGTVAKPWVVDEAFRKVHFQQGINRVLFRVENCYRVVAFSVVVSTRSLH